MCLYLTDRRKTLWVQVHSIPRAFVEVDRFHVEERRFAVWRYPMMPGGVRFCKIMHSPAMLVKRPFQEVSIGSGRSRTEEQNSRCGGA